MYGLCLVSRGHEAWCQEVMLLSLQLRVLWTKTLISAERCCRALTLQAFSVKYHTCICLPDAFCLVWNCLDRKRLLVHKKCGGILKHSPVHLVEVDSMVFALWSAITWVLVVVS